MADQEDEELMEELGTQLFHASLSGLAEEVARLLDMNAPRLPTATTIGNYLHRSWQPQKKVVLRLPLC